MQIKKRKNQKTLINNYSIVTLTSLYLFFLIPVLLQAQTYPAGFSQVRIASLTEGTAMAFAPDGRIFVCQRDGTVRIIKNGTLLSTQFLKLTTDQNGERGISGICFDPNFVTNGYLYIYYTATTPTIHNRLSRFTANGDVVLTGSEFTLLDAEPVTDIYHNGGGMGFGKDGKLYLSMGEDNNPINAQTLTTYKGKLLRFNSDGTTPSDNPYSSSTNAATKKIWCLGLRNPYTLSIQPGTGRIFVNNVGSDFWEEIHDGTSSLQNFGWPTVEGYGTDPAYTNPIFAYPHTSTGQFGCAITGGTFFNPVATNYPSQYVGKYFYMDFCDGWIYYLTPGTTSYTNNTLFATGLTTQNIALQVGTDGNLYYINRFGTLAGVYKIISSNNNTPVISSQPSSISVIQGQPASFNVSATGATPLNYEWRKNGIPITGANSASYNIPSTTTSDMGQYSVRVFNTFGSVLSNSATLTVTAFNAPPTATIITPAANTHYHAGDIINFSGDATDPEDGILPASKFEWTVQFWHNNNHFHPGPFISPGIKSGSFTIPNTGETSPIVFYRLILKVTDSNGLIDTPRVDILPLESKITMNTVPAGLQVTYDGQPKATTFTVQAVRGMLITIGAVSPQSQSGNNYAFDHWQQGGTKSHIIKVGDGDSTYTAVFKDTVSSCLASGTILREVWTNVTGTAVSNIPVSISPTYTNQLTIFEEPSNAADNFGSRIRGYICPPVTGNYTFWIASDDNSELWLSTNDNPQNKIKIGSVVGWTNSREWTKYPSQQSAAIFLTAGIKYYIESLHKEGTLGDNLSVGWQLPNGTLERPIPGSRLSPFTSSGTADPFVTITSPLNNASYTTPANITINANATTGNGSISKVEFFQGTTKIGEDLIAPYSFTWMNVTTGSYAIKAIATDNINATGTSQIITISVGSCAASGTILREVWTNVTGTAVSNIPVSISPTYTNQLTIFEEPSNAADNYGSRIRGYICPPVTGNYIFWIASDDNSELWLSTNDDPQNKRKIASVTGWTNSREWTKYPSQQSIAIFLTAGIKYYIESLHKEGTSGDNLSVGWQLPNGTLERPVPGSRLSPFTSSGTTAPFVTITSPANGTSYSTPANININANATSNGGTISKVEFFQGTTKIGEDLTAPYSFIWMNVTTGSYALKAIATDNTNATGTSQIINVTVASCLTPIITPSGPTNICSGTVILNTNTIPGNIYQWKKDGVNITGATNSSYAATVSGSYQIKVIQGSCISWSAPTTVRIQYGLSASITPGGPTSFCPGGHVVLYANTCSGYIYQWIKDGTPIIGATGTTYTASIAGSYQLRTTQNSLNAWSALVNVQLLTCKITDTLIQKPIDAESASDITNLSNDFQMKVFPNPTSGLFTITINMHTTEFEMISIRIVNVLGQEVCKKDIAANGENIKEVVELDRSLPAGIYTLKVIIGDNEENTNMILEK
jgi:glucose/arabinose dehydrogenase/chitodextrinase